MTASPTTTDLTLFRPPCRVCKGEGRKFNKRLGAETSCPSCGGDGIEPLATKARARASDPPTSHLAARVATEKLRPSQEAVLATFHQIGEMTDTELVAVYASTGRMTQSESGLRTRRHELAEAGYLEDSGRKKTIHPHGPAVVWRLRQKEDGMTGNIWPPDAQGYVATPAPHIEAKPEDEQTESPYEMESVACVLTLDMNQVLALHGLLAAREPRNPAGFSEPSAVKDMLDRREEGIADVLRRLAEVVG